MFFQVDWAIPDHHSTTNQLLKSPKRDGKPGICKGFQTHPKSCPWESLMTKSHTKTIP